LGECGNLELTVTVLNVSGLPDMDPSWGYGESDPYVTIFVSSACSDDECASSGVSSGCTSMCLKTSTQDDKESAVWDSGNVKTFSACIAPTEIVRVRVYDEDTGFTDELLLSADLPSGWATTDSSAVSTSREFKVASGSTTARASVRIGFRCCPS
jgi:hypothetical protein